MTERPTRAEFARRLAEEADSLYVPSEPNLSTYQVEIDGEPMGMVKVSINLRGAERVSRGLRRLQRQLRRTGRRVPRWLPHLRWDFPPAWSPAPRPFNWARDTRDFDDYPPLVGRGRGKVLR